MPDTDDHKGTATPSKSQRKRDMQALRDLGERLLDVPEEELGKLSDTDLVEAVRTFRKITRGNARKRQLQYIGKLMRNADIDEIRELLDRFDAGSRTHVQQFHQLEQWRERLIGGDDRVMEEIAARHPELDRQHLRQLTRNAAAERREEKEPPVQFRKLFQYLKSLDRS